MANFYLWTRTPGNRRYRSVYQPPFYDTNRADSGNYNSLGVLAGSMRGISAKKWESEIGHAPSPQEMQSITAEQAERIYKTDYWDEVKGDFINSQKLAELIADTKSSTGNVLILQKTLGHNLTGQMNTTNLDALNAEIAKDAQAFFLRYRANLVSYYSNISMSESHLRRLNRDYPETLKIDVLNASKFKSYAKYAFWGVIAVAGLFLAFKLATAFKKELPNVKRLF